MSIPFHGLDLKSFQGNLFLRFQKCEMGDNFLLPWFRWTCLRESLVLLITYSTPTLSLWCPGQVRSGQVRVFNVLIQSKLSWAQVLVPLSGTGKKGGGGEGVRGTACSGRYRRVQAVRLGSVTGGGCMMSRRIKQKRNMCTFQWRKFGANLAVCLINNCEALWFLI